MCTMVSSLLAQLPRSRKLEKRCRPHLKACNDSWRVDETDMKIKKAWMYLYRAVDSERSTLEFLLSPMRNAEAAKRFFCQSITHGLRNEITSTKGRYTGPPLTLYQNKSREEWLQSNRGSNFVMKDGYVVCISSFWCPSHGPVQWKCPHLPDCPPISGMLCFFRWVRKYVRRACWIRPK